MVSGTTAGDTMKKQVKKLRLGKETVQSLETTSVRWAAGQAATDWNCTSGTDFTYFTCDYNSYCCTMDCTRAC
jgi:hypothetical protein